MHDGIPPWQDCRDGSDTLNLWTDVHGRKREVRGRGGSGLQNRAIIHRPIRRTARMRPRHSGMSALIGHFLTAFFLGHSHRLSRQSAVQKWQAKQEKCQKPTADFAPEFQHHQSISPGTMVQRCRNRARWSTKDFDLLLVRDQEVESSNPVCLERCFIGSDKRQGLFWRMNLSNRFGIAR